VISPDGTSGKALALLIAFAMLGAIYLTAIAPLFSYYESTAQRLHDRQELARRYQNLAGELPRLRAAETKRRSQRPDGDLLLTGSTDAVASAMLQSTLKDLVEQQGAKLTSAQMLPAETEDSVLRRVGVRIAFSGNLKSLTTLLPRVETTRPVLSIGNLEIHVDGSNKEGERGALTIAMDVYGFVAR
jgi:general secretion pathway protein M